MAAPLKVGRQPAISSSFLAVFALLAGLMAHAGVSDDAQAAQLGADDSSEVGPYEPTIDPSSTEEWDRFSVEEAGILVQRFVNELSEDAHAGVWISQEDPPSIRIGLPRGAEQTADEMESEVREAVPGSYPLEILPREHSYAELDRLAGLLANAVASGESEEFPWFEEADREFELDQISVGPNFFDNSLEIFIGSGGGETTQRAHPQRGGSELEDQREREEFVSSTLSQELGVPVEVHVNALPSDEVICGSRGDCRPSLLGGLIVSAQGGCTTAFNASGGSGRHFIIGSGHCGYNQPGATWSHGGTAVGPSERNVVGCPPGNTGPGCYIDAARIVIENTSYWNRTNQILADLGDSGRSITSFLNWADVPLGGQFIGVTGGQGTGASSTGIATHRDHYYTQAATEARPGNVVERLFLLSREGVGDLCVAPGDSGAAMYRENAAVGVHKGSNRRTVHCSDPAYRSWGSSIQYVLDELSLTLTTTNP